MKMLKFGAVWCPSCLVMRKVWKKIETENSWLKTDYFDYDTDKEMIKKYDIDEILPVVIFINKQNEEVLRLHGEIEKDELQNIINKYKPT